MASALRNSIHLISGSFLAQLFGMATMPIVTRIYTPAEFGVFAVVIACLGIMSPVCTLRFNEVIILPKEDDEAVNVWALACFSSFCCSLLVLLALIVVLMSPYLQARFNIEDYRYYLLLVPLGIFLRGLGLNVGSLAIREAIFKKIALTTVVNKTGERLTTIVFGLLSMGAWGLIVGHLTGIVFSTAFLSIKGLKVLLLNAKRTVSFAEMKRLAVKYKNFPLYGPWSIFLHVGAKELIVFVLISVFSATTAGAYALGQNMIITPLYMLSSSLNRVFIRKAASLKEDPVNLVQETTEFIGYISYVALPAIVTLTFLGDHIFSLFFGVQWQTAGQYVQILAPAFFMVFIYNILREFFIIFEKARDRLIFDVVYFSLRGGSLLIAALVLKRPDYALSVMAMVTCLHILVFFAYVSNLLQLAKSHFILHILRKICMMAPLMGGLLAVRYYYPANVLLAFVILLAAYLVQSIIIVMAEPKIKAAVSGVISTCRARFFANRRKNSDS